MYDQERGSGLAMTIERKKEKVNGKDRLNNGEVINLADLYKNPVGRIDTIDTDTNEVIVLRPNGAVIEFLGMPKGGKSAQIDALLDNLKKDPELSDLEMEVFKPNTLQKLLFSKDPDKRAAYHDSIVSKHKSVLDDLYQRIKSRYVQSRQIDLAIFDRCVIDDLIWTEYLFKRRLLTQEEKDHFSMASHYSEMRIHLAIGMNVAPEEAMRREGETQGDVMNPRSLEQLYKHYMIFDFLNDPERKEEISSNPRYAPYLEEFLGTRTRVSTYYDFMKLSSADYIGIECNLEKDKGEDKNTNADRIFNKARRIIAARMQEELKEA